MNGLTIKTSKGHRSWNAGGNTSKEYGVTKSVSQETKKLAWIICSAGAWMVVWLIRWCKTSCLQWKFQSCSTVAVCHDVPVLLDCCCRIFVFLCLCVHVVQVLAACWRPMEVKDQDSRTLAIKESRQLKLHDQRIKTKFQQSQFLIRSQVFVWEQLEWPLLEISWRDYYYSARGA